MPVQCALYVSVIFVPLLVQIASLSRLACHVIKINQSLHLANVVTLCTRSLACGTKYVNLSVVQGVTHHEVDYSGLSY